MKNKGYLWFMVMLVTCGVRALLDYVSGLMGALHRRVDSQHEQDPCAISCGRGIYTLFT